MSCLVTRFHPRHEAMRVERDIMETGLPAQEIERRGGVPLDAGKQLDDFGARFAVTALDHRVTRRRYARADPVCRYGCWGNDIEIGVSLGLLIYDTEFAENPAAVRLRMGAGGFDRWVRSLGCRLALEEWKALQGVADQLAFPPDEAECMNLWSDLMTVGLIDPAGTIYGFVHHFVTPEVSWSWKVNVQPTTPRGGGTLTGVRTTSLLWRNKANTSWDPLTDDLTPPYLRDARRGRWSYGCRIQRSEGDDVPQLDSLTDRVNMLTVRECPRYMTHPDSEERHGICFLVEDTRSRTIAFNSGWSITLTSNDRHGVFPAWTWGLKSSIKSFAETDLRTLVLPSEIVALIGSKGFSPSNQLLGGADSYDAGGLVTSYFRRVRVLKPLDSLNATGPGRRSPTRAERIAALEAELARLKEDASVGVTEPIVDIKNAIVELTTLAKEEEKEREQEEGVVRGVVREQQ